MKAIKSSKQSAKAVRKPGTTGLTNMQKAAIKAIATGKMANTLAKALARRVKGRWKFQDFTSDGKKRESAGIVDIIAIRKNSSKAPAVEGLKPLDLFDIILIQVKGGSAPAPTVEEVARLKKVGDHYRATKIVYFEWIKEKTTAWHVLGPDGRWDRQTEAKIFK